MNDQTFPILITAINIFVAIAGFFIGMWIKRTAGDVKELVGKVVVHGERIVALETKVDRLERIVNHKG